MRSVPLWKFEHPPGSWPFGRGCGCGFLAGAGCPTFVAEICQGVVSCVIWIDVVIIPTPTVGDLHFGDSQGRLPGWQLLRSANPGVSHSPGCHLSGSTTLGSATLGVKNLPVGNSQDDSCGWRYLWPASLWVSDSHAELKALGVSDRLRLATLGVIDSRGW